MTSVCCKFSGGTIIYEDNVLFFDGCDNLLDEYLLNSAYFLENSYILVLYPLKFIEGNTFCVCGYL